MTNKEYSKLPHGAKAYYVVYNDIKNDYRVISKLYKTKHNALRFYDTVENHKPELFERIRGVNDAGVKIK
jgi:hypothetical protein